MGNSTVQRLARGRLGIGSVPLAGLAKSISERDAQAVIERALARGVDYIDTAPFYGLGRAEHLVGNALRTSKSQPLLSTKVGRLLRPEYHATGEREGWADPLPFSVVFDYSYDGVMRSFEDSQQRLGQSCIDILYVHDIGAMVHGDNAQFHWRQLTEGGLRALQELKRAGHVGAIGIGVNEWEVLMDALEVGDWDVFLLAGRYTLLEQNAKEPCLSACKARGVAVVCGGPFNGGALMGTGTWNYKAAPADILDRVRRIEAICERCDVPVGAAALQFPLAHPAISAVLAGPKSSDELDRLLQWMDTSIPSRLWDELRSGGLLAADAPVPDSRR
jgi:D-threo-aldose 1-dehydrogenase